MDLLNPRKCWQQNYDVSPRTKSVYTKRKAFRRPAKGQNSIRRFRCWWPFWFRLRHYFMGVQHSLSHNHIGRDAVSGKGSKLDYPYFIREWVITVRGISTWMRFYWFVSQDFDLPLCLSRSRWKIGNSITVLECMLSAISTGRAFGKNTKSEWTNWDWDFTAWCVPEWICHFKTLLKAVGRTFLEFPILTPTMGLFIFLSESLEPSELWVQINFDYALYIFSERTYGALRFFNSRKWFTDNFR